VDWAYRGSEFAPEQKFAIEPERTPLKLQPVYENGWKLCVSGQRGREFILEKSLDLKQWQPESTNSLVRWKASFAIPVANDQQSAFFRIRTEPRDRCSVSRPGDTSRLASDAANDCKWPGSTSKA